MARSLALIFTAWIFSAAQGDPVLSAEMSRVASPDAAAHENAAGEAVDDWSPDELLLDEAQASRLKEIPNLKAEFDSRGVPTVLEGPIGFYSVYHISGHPGWHLVIDYWIADSYENEMVIVDAVDGSFIHRRDVEIE